MTADRKRLADNVRRLQLEGKSRRSVPANAAEMTAIIEEANAAAGAARALREHWRRRGSPANPERLAAIEAALQRLHLAAHPLKVEQGRFPRDARRARRWGRRMREAAEAVQHERVALWKMKDRAKGRA